jgi:hypothetical protein
VAGDSDIEMLKKYATFHHHNGPTPILSSCTYGQLLKLNEGGLFAFNSDKAEYEPNLNFDQDRTVFQIDGNSDTNTTFN